MGFRERYPQNAGAILRIILIRFVEIPTATKQDVRWVFLFQFIELF